MITKGLNRLDQAQSHGARGANQVPDKQTIDANAKTTAEHGAADSSQVGVDLSRQGRELAAARAKALAIAQQTPDIREEKVARIKEQIENGTYNVESGTIADSILREAMMNHLVETEER